METDDYLNGLRDFLDLANWDPSEHPRNPANGRFISKGALVKALISRVPNLSPKSQAKVRLAMNPISADNVVKKWGEATPGELATGRSWYPTAHSIAKEISEDSGLSVRQAAGLMAVYSAQTRWGENMIRAHHVATTGKAVGGPGAHIFADVTALDEVDEARRGVMATRHARRRAAKILVGDKDFQEILAGGRNKSGSLPPNALKVRSFAELIATGEQPKNLPTQVVIDRHAAGVARGMRMTEVDYGVAGPSDSRVKFQAYADAFQQAADRISKTEGRKVGPEEVQAVTWLVQQRQNQGSVASEDALGERDVREALHYFAQYSPDIAEIVSNPMVGTADLANWDPADHPRNPANGRFIAKGAVLGALAEEIFGKIGSPKDGDHIQFETQFSHFDLTFNVDEGYWKGTKRASEHAPAFPVMFKKDMLEDLVKTGFLDMGDLNDTDAYRKFTGRDPKKFLDRRRVETKWTQVAPEDAYPDNKDYQYLAYKNGPMLFKRDTGDVVSIEGWGKYSDVEIAEFVEASDTALYWGREVSPRIRQAPVEITVPEVWDDDESVAAYVLPTVSADRVHVNPSGITERPRNKMILRALGRQQHFTPGVTSVDHPAEYHILHELGHIDDVRGGMTATVKGPSLNEIATENEFWRRNGRATHYAASHPAEGYAEHFALWASLQRGGVKFNNAGLEGEQVASMQALAAQAYAQRYGWEGAV